MKEPESPFTEPIVLPIEDSIDLHAFHPKDIPSVVEEYLEQCRQAGLAGGSNHSWPRHRCAAQYRAQHSPEAPAGSFLPGCSSGSRRLGRYGRGVGRKAASYPRKGVFALGFDEIVNGDQDADGDEAIGKIECRPVKVRPVEVEKIDDFPVRDPIDQVANRAAENEGECRDQSRFSVG